MSEDIVKGVSRALAGGVSRAVLALCASACAVTFDVDVNGVRPALLEAYRGESFEIAARFPQDFGVTSARFLWMTNTAADADVFTTNATVSADGVARAVFTGAMDAGAPVVPFFFAAETGIGTSFRASGLIRFRPSPGSTPSTRPFQAPSSTVDFSKIEALNAPWTTREAVEALVRDATNGIPAPPSAPDLSPYATKEEVASEIAAATNAVASTPAPDLSPYCTIEAARAMDAAVSNALAEAVAAIHVPSLDGYATEAWVTSALAGIVQPDLSPYATKDYADAAASNAVAGVKVPSLDGYATEAYVDEKVAAVQQPDLSPYATKGYADAAASNAAAGVNVPSLDGYATETYVDAKVAAVPQPDLSPYATKDYADAAASNAAAGVQVPSLEGYATETYVANAIRSGVVRVGEATRLSTEDGATWQDATGVVWRIEMNKAWVGTNGVVFVDDGSGTNYTNGNVRIYWDPYGDGGSFGSWRMADATYDVGCDDDGSVISRDSTHLVWTKQDWSTFWGVYNFETNAVAGYSTNPVSRVAYAADVAADIAATMHYITDGTNTITASGKASFAGVGKGYWMARLLPDGTWHKLVPVKRDNILWYDDTSNSSLAAEEDGTWMLSIEDLAYWHALQAGDYGGFSNQTAEAYYVPEVEQLATTNQIPTTAEQVGAATPEDVSSAAGSAVATANAYTDSQTTPLWSYLGAENFRVVVTNYDSEVHPPVASFEYRMTANEAFRTVWNETNGLNRAIATATNLALRAAKRLVDDPANKAWGKHDSETGEASPDGVIQATAPGGLMIGGDQRWSQISAESGWWILTSTDPTLCRTGTNGVFSIVGSDGQEAIRVVKGDRVTVPAPADGISAADGVCTVTYAVEAQSHPTARFAAGLGGGGGTVWYDEDDADCPVTMTWSGASGNYVLTFDTAGLSAGFVQATYEQGQESYASFGDAGLELTKIRIGGKVYTVGAATIDGKTVLTLE